MSSVTIGTANIASEVLMSGAADTDWTINFSNGTPWSLQLNTLVTYVSGSSTTGYVVHVGSDGGLFSLSTNSDSESVIMKVHVT